MNQTELATDLEVSESTVSRLVSGERQPSLSMIMKIEKRFPFWTLKEQVRAMEVGKYGEILAAVLRSEDK